MPNILARAYRLLLGSGEPKPLYPDRQDRPAGAPWHWQKWPDGDACRFQTRSIQKMIRHGEITWEGLSQLAEEDMASYEVHIKLSGYTRALCEDAAQAVTKNKRLFPDWGCHTDAATDKVNTFWVTVDDQNDFTIVLHCIGFGMTRTKGATFDAFHIVNNVIGLPTPDQNVSANIVKVVT